MISGYMSELYSRYLKGWRMEQTKAMDQAGNKKTECIWNYPDSQSMLFSAECV
jgi:hypothetical protein